MAESTDLPHLHCTQTLGKDSSKQTSFLMNGARASNIKISYITISFDSSVNQQTQKFLHVSDFNNV